MIGCCMHRFFIAASLCATSFTAFAAERLSPDNFGDRFEVTPIARRLHANAYKVECRDGFRRTCAYSVLTTTIEVQSRDDNRGLRSVSVACATGCEPIRALSVITIIIKMVAPNPTSARLNTLIDAASKALENKETEIVDLGRAQFIASPNSDGLNVTIAFKDVGEDTAPAVPAIATAKPARAPKNDAPDKATFVRNLSILVYAQERCPQLRINLALLAQAWPTFGVNASDIEPGGPLHDEVADQRHKIEQTFGAMDNAEFCAFVEDSFGPGGTIAPGVIKRR